MPTREKVIFEYSHAGRGASDQWPQDVGAAPLADLPAPLADIPATLRRD